MTDRPSPTQLKNAAKTARDACGHPINIDIPEAIMPMIMNPGYFSQLLMVSLALNQDTGDAQLTRDCTTALEDASATHDTLHNIGMDAGQKGVTHAERTVP